MPEARAAIDRERGPDGSLDRAALLRILPYGSDFLFLDRVTRLTDSEAEAHYGVPADTPWMRAHFVDQPIMPGVLVGEGFAQAGTLLVRYRVGVPAGRHVIGMQIEQARFTGAVFPGDLLTFEPGVVTASRRAARLEGSARVGERQVGRFRIVVGITDRAALERARG